VDFLNVHPFRDGNGRTARILMNLINLKHKIPLFSPRSERDHRMNYYQTFNECDEQKTNDPMVLFLGKQLIGIMQNSIQKQKGKDSSNEKDNGVSIA
jgi:Fic family protein